MTVRRMEALELAEVLGTLLSSVIEAQTQSARATIAFVDEVGFESTADGERMRTVTLRYTKKDEDGQRAQFEVEVPLLSLVNVPSLAVDEAKLAFGYDIVTAQAAEETSGGEARPLTGSKSIKAAHLKGFLKRRTNTPSTGSPTERRTTSIDLDVTLRQQEIPIGIERLFDLAELGITEEPVSDG